MWRPFDWRVSSKASFHLRRLLRLLPYHAREGELSYFLLMWRSSIERGQHLLREFVLAAILLFFIFRPFGGSIRFWRRQTCWMLIAAKALSFPESEWTKAFYFGSDYIIRFEPFPPHSIFHLRILLGSKILIYEIVVLLSTHLSLILLHLIYLIQFLSRVLPVLLRELARPNRQGLGQVWILTAPRWYSNRWHSCIDTDAIRAKHFSYFPLKPSLHHLVLKFLLLSLQALSDIIMEHLIWLAGLKKKHIPRISLNFLSRFCRFVALSKSEAGAGWSDVSDCLLLLRISYVYILIFCSCYRWLHFH